MGAAIRAMELSKDRYALAMHVLHKVYPTVENPRLLLNVLQHTFLSMNYAMNAVLEQQKEQGLLKKYSKTFLARLSSLQKHAERLDFQPEAITVLAETREILIKHQESPVEFPRDGKLVICDNKYGMKVLTVETLTNYLDHAKVMIENAERIIYKDVDTSHSITA